MATKKDIDKINQSNQTADQRNIENKNALRALDKDFWEYRYKNNLTGWDMGVVSPPIKAYVDQLKDKDIKILIPGAGKSHEAEYLLQQGFSDITVIDISSLLINQLKEQFKDNPEICLIEGDFFAHSGQYDLILEQTFFCTLYPENRPKYVDKMNTLLKKEGKLCGVLFDRIFEGGPPFGGRKIDYQPLFSSRFKINKMEPCYNSHPARKGTELWIDVQLDTKTYE